jgi:hypothetical protein
MQRKQQVGECWVCVIFFACVCVGTSDSTMSNDPCSSSLFVLCFIGCFPRGVPEVGAGEGGGMYAPPWLRASPQNLFLGVFCYF